MINTLDIFSATNPNAAAQVFYNEHYYNAKVLELYDSTLVSNYIDLWYDVPFYGKVNEKGELRVPKKEFINFNISRGINTYKFVLNALYDFSFFMKRGKAQGNTHLSRVFRNFETTDSFYDSEAIYKKYAISILEDYNRYIVRNNKLIWNLKGYICEFFRFLKLNKIIFSFYSIYAGPLIPVNASGLVVEFKVENPDHNNQVTKDKIYNHPEFPAYVQSAANFGFRVNKNAPWMLIADLNSKPMLVGRTVVRNNKEQKLSSYLHQEFIPDIKTLFETYFDSVMKRSYDLFQYLLFYSYKQYQVNTKYMVKHGQSIIHPLDGNIVASAVTSFPSHQIPISKLNDSVNVLPSSYFLTKYEELLYNEFNATNMLDHLLYGNFKNNFDKDVLTETPPKMLDSMETFYNLTNIFDPTWNKPDWSMPKNNLTPKKQNIMIPNEKQNPTAGKVVTEFFTGH